MTVRHDRMVIPLLLFLLAGAALAPLAAGAAPAPVTAPSVKDSPGYHPPADPDSAAERLGRRVDAPAVSVPFRGGGRSLEALSRAVLGAFHAERADSLLALCVTPEEFRDVMWREFPQSRPATGLTWEDAWPVLYGRLNGGSLAAMREFGGHAYTLLRVERRETVPYRNFKLHNGITLVARDEEGREVRCTAIRSIAERRGRFKIYSMTD